MRTPSKKPRSSQPTPLSDDGLEAAKKDETASDRRLGSGEDPLVESGLPEDDPEQPRETDTQKSLE